MHYACKLKSGRPTWAFGLSAFRQFIVSITLFDYSVRA